MDKIVTEKDYPVRRLWILKAGFWSILCLIILALLGWIMIHLRGDMGAKLQLLINLMAIAVFAIAHLISIILRRITFHYSIEDKFLIFKQGVLSKQERHIPYWTLQNLCVTQSLFDRIFGLYSLIIENAAQGGTSATSQNQVFFRMKVGVKQQPITVIGFSGNRAIIPGLAKKDVEILKKIILQKMKENPTGDDQSGL